MAVGTADPKWKSNPHTPIDNRLIIKNMKSNKYYWITIAVIITLSFTTIIFIGIKKHDLTVINSFRGCLNQFKDSAGSAADTCQFYYEDAFIIKPVFWSEFFEG